MRNEEVTVKKKRTLCQRETGVTHKQVAATANYLWLGLFAYSPQIEKRA